MDNISSISDVTGIIYNVTGAVSAIIVAVIACRRHKKEDSSKKPDKHTDES